MCQIVLRVLIFQQQQKKPIGQIVMGLSPMDLFPRRTILENYYPPKEMVYEKQLDRFRYLHELIRSQCTGPAGELADKLNVSRRTLFEYLSHLKQQGACICWCRTRKTYYYEEPWELKNF